MIKVNNKEIKFKQFPNGETDIELESLKGISQNMHSTMRFTYENDSDLIKLMLTTNHLKRELNQKITLEMTYMPYSRMDRSENGSVFTLKYVSEFINNLGFEKVVIIEPHSDVCMALVNNSVASPMSLRLFISTMEKKKSGLEFDKKKDFIYFPDATAEKRYSKFIDCKSMTGLKQRDFETGRIKKLDVFTSHECNDGFNVIMIDDLCSRGGTFLLGAKKLKEMGANKISLVVAHCEDSVFDGDLLNSDLIDVVYTTDSMMRRDTHPKIVEYKI